MTIFDYMSQHPLMTLLIVGMICGAIASRNE